MSDRQGTVRIPRLLIARPNDRIRDRVVASLRATEPAPDHVEVDDLASLQMIDLDAFDLVVCDVRLDGKCGGEVVRFIRTYYTELPVVVTGGAEDVQEGVEAIRLGAIDFAVMTEQSVRLLPVMLEKWLAHHRTNRENEHLQARLSESLAELEMKNLELNRMISQLEAMARTDDLTGLANRRWLNLMLEGHWAEATRHDHPLACMMIDLDGFKRLNDRLGHQRGDEMLRLAGRVIEANCRDVDTTARYGGDEFCVLMPHTDADEAVRVAERVLREFKETNARLEARERIAGMSIGVAQIDLSRPLNAEQLLGHADEAMYAAKAAGKGCVKLREWREVGVPDPG